jgi:hypothetical protein
MASEQSSCAAHGHNANVRQRYNSKITKGVKLVFRESFSLPRFEWPTYNPTLCSWLANTSVQKYTAAGNISFGLSSLGSCCFLTALTNTTYSLFNTRKFLETFIFYICSKSFDKFAAYDSNQSATNDAVYP